MTCKYWTAKIDCARVWRVIERSHQRHLIIIRVLVVIERLFQCYMYVCVNAYNSYIFARYLMLPSAWRDRVQSTSCRPLLIHTRLSIITIIPVTISLFYKWCICYIDRIRFVVQKLWFIFHSLFTLLVIPSVVEEIMYLTNAIMLWPVLCYVLSFV